MTLTPEQIESARKIKSMAWDDEDNLPLMQIAQFLTVRDAEKDRVIAELRDSNMQTQIEDSDIIVALRKRAEKAEAALVSSDKAWRDRVEKLKDELASLCQPAVSEEEREALAKVNEYSPDFLKVLARALRAKSK